MRSPADAYEEIITLLCDAGVERRGRGVYELGPGVHAACIVTLPA